MSNIWKRSFALMILVIALGLLALTNVGAQSLSLKVTPVKATSNSVYTFIATWKQEDGLYPSPTTEKASNRGMVVLTGIGYENSLIGGIPMYYFDHTPNDGTGARFVVSVSAGLNMGLYDNSDGPWILKVNPNQNPDKFITPNVIDPSSWYPSTNLNNLLWDAYTYAPLWYAPALTSYDNGPPCKRTVKAFAWYFDKDGKCADSPTEATADVTVCDSRPNLQYRSDGIKDKEMINYAGRQGDRDILSAGGAGDPDPLTVEPTNDGSGITGDDGSASHDYVFRVKYRNRDGLPPMPWWHSNNYSPYDYMEVADYGVALYLDVFGIGDYRLIPMMPEIGIEHDAAWTAQKWTDGVVFTARLQPNDGLARPFLYEYNKKYFPAQTCWAYNALPVGTFNYFFACSDDWLRYSWNEPDLDTANYVPNVPNFLLEMQPDSTEWGVQPNPGYTWNIPTGYTDYRHTGQLNRVCRTINWTQLPSDATDSIWGYVPWGRNDSGLTYSCPPDFTTVPGHANNNALDPIYARQVTGYTDINRSAHRSYSTDGKYAFDSTILVDRPVFVPGKFGSTYQYPSTQHPIVGGGLTVPLWDDQLVSYGDLTKYGGGRYYGTLLIDGSFKRAMNPLLPGTYLDTSHQREITARRAETAGATTSSQCTFRIMYKSRDGRAPANVSLLIGDKSSRGALTTEQYPDTDGDGYAGVTMQVDPTLNDSGLDYTKGVWYIYRKNFTTTGPHNYLFVANDGSQKIVWPRRPDHYDYLSQTWDDWWVPTENTSDEYLIDDPDNAGQKKINPDYDNNDFVPGPYVNNAPVLTVGSDSVTPTSGKQGQTFKFRVLYKDADGQRPYNTNLIIETDSKGTQRVCKMLPEVVLDSTADNSALYKSGVYYYFNTASVQDMVLEKGTRRYKFQFTDDWGRQVGLDDRIEGESVTTNWISNLTIKANSAPTLYDGAVESVDGTKNAATLWTFSATYADLDNDAPTLKKVFIGCLQPDGKTVLWDSGHDMLQSDTSDATYNDGVVFYYQARLGGKENSYDSEKQYYYAFLFRDGYQWATYKSSSNAQLRSNAANCITGEALTSSDGMSYELMPVIVQQGTPDSTLSKVTPTDSSVILNLLGVYLTEDLDGTNYYNPVIANPAYVTGKDTIVLTQALPANTSRVWLKYVPQAPIVGPLLDSSSSQTDIISDAQVYDGDTLKLVDDMKSGWQRTADGDERYSIMAGTAVDSQSNPSTIYVKPEDTSVIASVEGVYASLDDIGDQANSYYDPTDSISVPNSIDTEPMQGTIDSTDVYDQVNRTGKKIIPDNARLIKSVIGIYTKDGSGNLVLLANSNEVTFDATGKITLPDAKAQTLGSTVYIYYTRTMYNTGDSMIWLTKSLPTAGQTVFIKYSDIRFTHTVTGKAQQQDTSGNWTQGITYFSPSGWEEQEQGGDTVHIKGNDGVNNDGDPTSGLLGVWATNSDSSSYFDPFKSTYANNPAHLQLTYQAPSGTDAMWARYYQLGDYQIDRWNRIIEFLPGSVPSSTVNATYLFGSKMPMTVGANNAPTLDDGSVTPISSESASQQFVYTVTYTDTDGPSGQAPSYVRVYIDGVAHDMVFAGQGTPPYRDGAVYTYTATQLSSKGHKYRFEASDGADVAIYDYYSKNDPDNRPADDVYLDLDGPYVNSKPSLLNGSVTPAKGTPIAAGTSVTFAVTYQDADNDAPYFYNANTDIGADNMPVGQNVSGSPRVWVDDDGTDTLVLGKIASIAPDPMQPSKNRLIIATNTDGTSPGWTKDAFKDKLMQITSAGSQAYCVYLIQSNTSNTLTIATDDLNSDVVNQTFSINGLLMIRQDTNAFTVGSKYSLTVPRLAVGSHKYRFTARSRVTKPQWLIDIETAQGKTWVPYSEKASYPTDGTKADAPDVTSTAPTGNSAPVLSSSALYYGPKVKYATYVSDSKVRLNYGDGGNWTTQAVQNIDSILGVYWNPNPIDTDTNYYDTTQVFNPTTSNEITLSPQLGDVPAELVQLGSIGSSSMEIVPDSIGVIDSVEGVYDNAGLTGANYFSGAITSGATSITLTQALPGDTTQVYIKYVPNSDVKPPLYVKYNDKYSATTMFLSGENLTFKIKYTDADNDPPTYHDGVTGYLRLVFGTSTSSTKMVPESSSVTSYASPVMFTATVDDLPEGATSYHFEASDGYDSTHIVRYPASASSDSKILVNCKPTLTSASVDPSSGQKGTTFKFSVAYKDLDGNATGAPTPSVQVVLTNTTTLAITTVDLSTTTGAVYTSGAVFTGTVTNLDPGKYNVTFIANDGYQSASSVTYTGGLNVRELNTAPLILSYEVAPVAGKSTNTFAYGASYYDADNDPPVVGTGTQRSEGLTLVVDKGLSTQQKFTMTRSSSTTTPAYNGVSGVQYQVSVLGSKLGKGSHTYTVEASDGTDNASVPTPKSGPVLLIPSFENLRVVDASSADPDSASGLTSAKVGDSVLVVGRMLFPVNTVTDKPGSIDDVAIKVTKPDGTNVSLVASVTMTNTIENSNWVGKLSVPSYPSGVDSALVTGENLTLSASGQWDVSASWNGGSAWDSVVTDTDSDGVNDGFSVVVGGPMRTVAVKDPTNPYDSVSDTPVIDMITPPMLIGSSDPGAIFGYDYASLMQIVRWYPALGAYYRFGASGTFPGLKTGEAVWIRPKYSYPKESIQMSDVTNGLLAIGNDGSGLDYSRDYRLINIFSKAYSTQTNSKTGETELAPCSISLIKGWNQFGNIFFNWKKDSAGNVVTPKEDIGIPISELRVKYLNVEKSLDDAAAAGWIRNYAWRWDASAYDYVLVHASTGDAEHVLKAWYGYWIKAFVNCTLIVDPNTSYNGTSSVSSVSSLNSVAPSADLMSDDMLDMPPKPSMQ